MKDARFGNPRCRTLASSEFSFGILRRSRVPHRGRRLATERDSQSGVDSETGPLEAGRIFVATIEKIIDPREDGDASAEIVIGREIHQIIIRRVKPLDG